MLRHIQISKLLLSLSLSLIIFSDAATAAVLSIDQIELGKVIDVNGQKFVKVRQDANKGAQFLAFQPAVLPGSAEGMDMDQFTPAMCNSAPTPSGTDYFLIGNLVDSRDGKSYEVRKFADGKCWMVDNLMYGGVTDNCVDKTTFAGDGSAAPSNIFGAGTYGDCRNNPGDSAYGYLYNWQAAVQDPNAYHGINYQPTEPTQGICPAGWHLPTGNTNGEYNALHIAAGSPAPSFWRGGSWKGVFSGVCGISGSLSYQGIIGNYWSSTQHNTVLKAYVLGFTASNVNSTGGNDDRYNGLAVRCIKDTTERTMQSFTTADCDAYPTPSGIDYTPVGQLKDERDGKSYEIRKFADGKCWMVDNLMYGGAVDNCAGVDSAGYTNAAYGGANGSASPSNRFGAGTYGNCRDPRVGGATPCTIGSTTCGYYYNWQAAMQHASAYQGATYTGPTTNVQGICPQGWHLPSGNTGGEFATLDIANGGTGASRSCNTSDATCNFWRPGYNGKQVYSGYVGSSGSLYGQGSYLTQWSASENSTSYAWYLDVGSSSVNPGTSSMYKTSGFTVRCIKN